jgi:capsular polysaccharide biosynthesis protein
MELSDYLRILRQRGWIILLMGLLTAVAAFGYSRMQTELYESNVRVLITSRPDFGQTQATKALLRDFAAYLGSSFRAQAVIDQLQLDMTPQQLLADVTIAAATDSNIIQIQVENSNPNLANDIARVWAEQLIIYRQQENAGLREEDRIKAQLLDDPQAGLTQPRTNINTAAGLIFGALLGVIAIILLEWLDAGTVRRAADVERFLNVPLIGQIPQQ